LVVVLKGCLKSMLYNQIIRGFLYLYRISTLNQKK
jgi:hypothetical protein